MNPPSDLPAVVAAALAEDVGGGDLTAQLVTEQRFGRASVITREKAILAGRPYVDEVFRQVDPRVQVEWQANDGDSLVANQLL